MMLLADKHVAIIGGGPGGLTLAKLLQLQGIMVKVYERDLNSEVRQQGATLDLHEESGLEALRRAGLMESFQDHYRPEAGRLRITDKYLNIGFDDHTAEASQPEQRPEIDRGPLRDLLIHSLSRDAIVWDSHFLNMEKENKGWRLYFKNGTTAYADIVVAADGANSKIRSYITDVKPIYSGITIVEGNIGQAARSAPELWRLTSGGKVFAFGDQQSIILSAKGDGSLSFYTGCKVPETWVKDVGIDFRKKEEIFAWFQEAFGSWHMVFQKLFAGEETWFVPRPQYHFPLDQKWISRPNLTMIGDAAHRMPPYAGEGVNMAMQDAFELAACLSDPGHDGMLSAISAYEMRMLKRSSDVTQLTLDSAKMLHSDDPIGLMLEMINPERDR
ncbi:MAG: FAD-dependent oxidoreductase [Arcticibacter sp.]